MTRRIDKEHSVRKCSQIPLGWKLILGIIVPFFRRFGSENAHAIRHIHYAVFSRASRLTIGIYFLSLFSFSLSFCFTFLSTRRVLIFKGARENKSVRKRWLVISGLKSGKKRCCQFRFSCTLWACEHALNIHQTGPKLVFRDSIFVWFGTQMFFL